MAFDPDAFLAEDTTPKGGFDPDAFLAESAPSPSEQKRIEETQTGGGRSIGDRISDLVDGIEYQAKDTAKTAVGLGEFAVQTVTGLGSAAFGTLGGAVKEGYDYLTKDKYKPGEGFMDVFHTTTEELTYRPQTDYGKMIEGYVAIPFEFLAEQGKNAGDYVFEKTGNAALATAVRTGIEGAAYIVPYLGAKGMKPIKATLEKRAVKKLQAQKEVENIQHEARQKVLDKEQKKELERKVIERFDEVSAEHRGIKGIPETIKNPRSGSETLLTESDIISREEYTKNWKEANGLSLSKKKLDKKTQASIDSEYNDYRSRTLIAIEGQFARARAELNGEVIRPDSPSPDVPPGYIEHLRSKAAREQRIEESLAVQKGKFQEHVAKEQKIQTEAQLWDEAQYRYQEQYNLQEEMAWEEKGIIDAAERTQVLLDHMVQPVGKTLQASIDDHVSSRGGIGRQRGAVNPSVYAEGLIKAGKQGVEFVDEMVSQFGEQWRQLAPSLYSTLSEKMAAHESNKSIVEQRVAKASTVDTGGFITNLTSPTNFIPTTIEIIGGKAVSMLRRKAKNNPYLKEIVDKIERSETYKPGEIPKADMTAAYHMETGDLIYKLETAMEPLTPKVFGGLRTTLSKLSKGKNEKLVNMLRTPKKFVDEIPVTDKLTKTAADIRKILDSVVEKGKEVGLNVGYLEGYFPRIYAWRKIKNNKQKFLDTIKPYVRDGQMRDAIYDHIIEREGLLLPDTNRSKRSQFLHGRDGPARSGNLEMERELGFIPDHVLHPFLENDVFGVLSKYIEHSVGRIEAARRFGPNEEILLDSLNKAVQYGSQIGDPITKLEAHRLFDLVDAHQRNWIAIKNPAGRTMTRAEVAFMNAVTLPLAVFTSMPEAMMPFYKGGLRAYASALPKTFFTTSANTARYIYSGLPKVEAQKFAERLLKSSDLAATERVSAMYNGEVNALNSVTFQLNFLHQWTKTMNILAGETFKNMADQYLKVKAGRGTAWWNKKAHARMEKVLNDLGMDTNAGVEWVKRGMPKDGDPFYEQQYRLAAVNFIHENVMTSRPSVRPMWHSIPHLAPIAHLKGFPSMFGAIVMKNWYHDTLGEFRQKRFYNGTRNTAYMLATGAAMLYIADIAFDIKDHYKYGDKLPASRKSETEFHRLLRISDAAGFLGGWSTLKSGLTAKAEWGGTSWMAMLGPTVAKSGEVMDGLGSSINGSGNRQLARALASNLPVANINKEVLKERTDEVESFLNEIFPVNKKKKRGKVTNPKMPKIKYPKNPQL